jgi:glycosyltransferase involved in cell wall biosynthesis
MGMTRRRKIKVAFVSQPWDGFVPPVQSGSIPIWTYEVIRRLQEDCEFVVYSKQKKGQPKEENREGIVCRRLPIELDKLSHKFLRRIPFVCSRNCPFFAGRFYHPLYILNIARDLRERECDIVHVMNFSQFVPVIRAFNPACKIVLNMHCEWLTQLPPIMIERRLTRTDMVVGCSDFVTRQVRRLYPEVADRCQTVFNGVGASDCADRPVRKRQTGEMRLLFVNRLSPEKGVHVLLDAFARVVKRYPQARLKIVGPEGSAPIDFLVTISANEKIRNLASFYSGHYMDFLKNQMSPEVADRVTFTGFVDHSKLIEYYDEADILVNSSLWESFGRSLIEAMVRGVPVVATRVGGIPEIVEDGKTGVLVEDGDASALADGLIRLLADEELRLAMGEAGRQRVMKYFTWDVVAESMLARYSEVMRDYG